MRELSRTRLLAAFFGLCSVGALGRALLHDGALVPLLAAVAMLLSVTAARAYRPGDPPRRAWIWLSCAAWLAVLGESANVLFGSVASDPLMALSNALWCVSLLDARRKIVRGALVPPLSQPWRWALAGALVAAIVLAVEVGRELVAGTLAPSQPPARQGHVAFVRLCDGVVLVAGVWLLGALHPLWGGAAARPFLLVTAAAGCFVFSDFAAGLLPPLASRALIIGGWALLGVAGLAQLDLRRAMFAGTARLRASLAALGPRSPERP